jgi:hypothetical protein
MKKAAAENPADKVFKPRMSQSEIKVDATTRAARAIIKEEVSVREAKTERLRKARLAQENVDPAVSAKRITEKMMSRRKR